MAARSWIVRPKPAEAATVRLVCIPYAGGGVNVYRAWAGLLPPSVELCVAQLPGREVRLSEPLLSRSGPVLDALESELAPLGDRPLALFGHSMGALLAFELARRLERAGFEVAHLIVSGWRAPQLPDKERLHDLPEPAFIEAVRRFGGTPDLVFQNAELLQLVLPILRSDLALVETHVAEAGEPLACPILALGGLRDEAVSKSDVEGWREQTKGPFRAAFCDAGHLFLQPERDFVLTQIGAALKGTR